MRGEEERKGRKKEEREEIERRNKRGEREERREREGGKQLGNSLILLRICVVSS
jgi:hypothetical protein